jgi:hypothetical protein
MSLLVRNTFFIVLLLASLPAFSQLSVMDPTRVGSKSAYIDEATIVVQPHGGYVEEALYLEYGDHLQFPGVSLLEITHQFELPTGSAVNDLWLWIDNKVMKGLMFDTWTGRHIYDSIVVRKKDPALLTKNGSRYTLHIYPLVSGQRRKIKLSYIVPTRWLGGSATAELPLTLLKASGAAKKPVRVLFKTNMEAWGGVASIKELPALAPKSVFDSAGYRYKFYQVLDVSNLTSLSIGFSVSFPNAIYAPLVESRGDSLFYQMGIDPAGWGVVSPDTGRQSVAVALDLSGFHTSTLATELAKVRNILHRALRPIDRFRLFVAGRDSIKQFRTWCKGDSVTIDTTLNAFAASPFGVSMTKTRKPNVLFCDASAADLWSFAGIDSFATVWKFTDIVSASPSFSDVDVAASYRHGNEDAGIQVNNLALLRGRVDTMLMKGKRFLGFFDYNRPGKEGILTYFINGLGTTYSHSFPSATLLQQPGGYISPGFLPTYTTGAVNFLKWTDAGAVKELADTAGQAAVISKPEHNGRVVVSGLWSFAQDLATRKSLSFALLGLGAQSLVGGVQQLRPLLLSVQSGVRSDTVNQVLVVSNADSAVSEADANVWAAGYLLNFNSPMPVFQTVNLQDGGTYIPGIVNVNGVEYYGGGYQLQALASATRGMHFETHIRDWNYVLASLTYTSSARLDSLRVVATPSNPPGTIREQIEVSPEPTNYQKPRFFLGIASAALTMKYDVYARFVGVPGELHREATTYSNFDTTGYFLATMLGWDKLQKKFLTESTDTVGIVKEAMAFNLVCDYTCLLCLEPDSLHRPLVNPIDESKFITHVWEAEGAVDSISCGAYPNPFNGQTTISIRLPRLSDVTIAIYNILGQKVREFNRDAVVGALSATWNAANDRGSTVASGIYIVRVNIKEQSSGHQETRSLRLLLLK